MFNPHLQRLLAQSHAEDLRRDANGGPWPVSSGPSGSPASRHRHKGHRVEPLAG